MRKYKIMLIIFSVIIIFTLIILKITNVYAQSQYGSNGDEVKQIQTKLKAWGYYNGNIDGIYGSRNI